MVKFLRKIDNKHASLQCGLLKACDNRGFYNKITTFYNTI